MATGLELGSWGLSCSTWSDDGAFEKGEYEGITLLLGGHSLVIPTAGNPSEVNEIGKHVNQYGIQRFPGKVGGDICFTRI